MQRGVILKLRFSVIKKIICRSTAMSTANRNALVCAPAPARLFKAAGDETQKFASTRGLLGLQRLPVRRVMRVMNLLIE
jgi:hypothetical protein